MTDAHLQIAYWSVLKDLEPGADIPVARINAVLPDFLASTGTSAKASAVLSRALSDIAWDWPAWNDFAKKAGYQSLRDIELEVAKLRPTDILKSLSQPELTSLCQERNVTLPSRATKSDLIAGLLKAVAKDDIPELVMPFRRRLKAELEEKYRKRMAVHMASRILLVAHNTHRYEQLNDPELLSVRPNWRFVWGGATDIDAPKACRKFNNKKLPHHQAKEVFPALPCDYLHCACHIVAEGSSRRIR